jgi:3-hydroxyacyl-[acyl-carrier-protein] dehydratase
MVTAPFDYAAIARILPHRHPFLLVDRVTEFEPDRRIVGIKNVSSNEPYVVRCDEAFVLPPTILMEAMAQVGAILVLAKPENRDRLIYFLGVTRARYRRPARAGDVVVMEARVDRIRGMMGRLKGEARVDGAVIASGSMSFALGSRDDLPR